MYRIGQLTKMLDISADTLRYYEKIQLLPAISRNKSGLRIYTNKDISRIRFIKRAQFMNFSLKEIAQLLTFRESPQQTKSSTRLMASSKLQDIDTHISELQILRNELDLLVNLCINSKTGCPIIEGIDEYQ